MKNMCVVDGCDSQVKVKSRGFCGPHYRRWLKHGDPLGGNKTFRGDLSAWLDYAAGFQGNECLEWPFARYRGYGAAEGGKAHRRVMVRVLGRELGRKEIVCHACDNPPCCNPNHLVVADQAWNIQDMHNKRRGKPYGKKPLTKKQVKGIRKLLSYGCKQTQIAKLYCTTKSNVWHIKHAKTHRVS